MPAKPLNPCSGHPQKLCGCVRGHAVWGQEFLNEDFAGMYGAEIVLSHVVVQEAHNYGVETYHIVIRL